MRLGQLRVFVEIVEAGSIRAAARRRGVSQPALTKSLRLLETDLGVRLLQRTAQGIILTSPGRAILARARAIHAQLAKAREDIAQIAGNQSGAVAFGASASGLVLVPAALERFRSEYPRAEVRVVEGAPRALLPLLRDQTLDFFIGPRRTGPRDPQVHVRPLFRLPVAIVGRRGHSLRQARSLAALSGASWVLLSSGGWADSLLGDAFRTAGVPKPDSVIQCESYATAVALLAGGDTLGLIPRLHLQEPELHGQIEEIPVADKLPELAFALYLRVDDTPTGAALGMIRIVTSAARAMVARARDAG